MAEDPTANEETKPEDDQAPEAADDAAQADEPTAAEQEQAAEAVAAAKNAVDADDPPEQADGMEVEEVDLPDADESAQQVHDGQIDILLDTTMPVEIRLGDVEMEVRNLLKLGQGSIITLDKQVGEPMDLYLKGIRFATGQLVVAGENLGVRITEILPRRKSDRQSDQPNQANSANAPQPAET